MQHVSDLHPKITLRPHMCASTADIQSATRERLGEEKNKEEEDRRRNHRAKI